MCVAVLLKDVRVVDERKSANWQISSRTVAGSEVGRGEVCG